MPFRHYPDATPEQLDWMKRAVPMLRNGQAAAGKEGFVVVVCVDSRPNKRVILGQAADHLMSERWDASFVDEVYRVFRMEGVNGEEVVNQKVLNMWRYDWLTPYCDAMAGGRFSQDSYSTYYTLESHDVPVVGVYLTQHDQCAASVGEPTGIRLEWGLAIQATVHDLWRTQAGRFSGQIPVFSAQVQTEQTQLVDIQQCLLFDWQAYDELVDLCDSYEVSLPNEDHSSFEMAQLPAWSAATRACLKVEERQDELMIAHRRLKR